jgi:predicted ArsR family transcriptional regulator
MNFDIDVLITFADKDNESSKKVEGGWASNFKRFLELMLYQVLGEKPKVALKSEFDSMTGASLGNVGVMVSILSHDFITSGQCLDTVESFVQKVGDSVLPPRLFKVLKAPLTIQEQPARMRDLFAYEMYQLDIETGQMREYSDFFSPEAEKQYWMIMVDLAYDIHESLIFLKDGSTKAEVKSLLKRKTIYLAETGHDLSIQRNIIKRELQRYGYVVLPKHALPQTDAAVQAVVTRELEDCSYSIHLIGNSYGEIPEGAEKSVVEIQNDLAAKESAAKRGRKEDFTRLIWISANLRNISDKQKSFIEALKRDSEAQEGTEILQTPLEDFKNIMREELVEAHDRKGGNEVHGKTIYLLHDRVDQNEVKPYLELLEKNGFDVIQPAFTGELLDVRKHHINNLRNLDGAIIFKGKVNDQWVRMKVLDLLKAPGFGRNKPIKAKALMADNATLANYKDQNLTLISAKESNAMENLKSFLAEF